MRRNGRQPGTLLVRPRLLLVLAAACAIVVVLVGGWQLWVRQLASGSPPVPDWTDSFAGAAFSPDATAQQLNAEAERVAEELLATFPDNPSALNVLARWKYVSGDLDSAVELWHECLALDPNFNEALYALGVIAIEEDEYEQAIELFERLRLTGTTDLRVPVLLAEALLKTGRVEESRAVLEEHVRTQPTSAEALVTLGQVHLHLREYDKAIEHYQTALRAVPELRTAHYGLGQAYMRLGEQEKAQQAMQAFEALAEDHLQNESRKAKDFLDRESAIAAAAQTHDDAARVYHQQGRLAEAEELWRKAVYLAPENIDYWTRLLALYEQTGRYRKALQVGRQLVEACPEDVDHWLNLAALSARVEQPEEALMALERAIALDPDDPRCREAYELVNRTP